MSSQIATALDRQFKEIINKSTKKLEKIPAIDRFFMDDHDYITYVPPPPSILNPTIHYTADLSEYKERLTIITNDLKWILSLQYQKFWCQVVYNSGCQRLIDSYLKLAPRTNNIVAIRSKLPIEIAELHDTVHKYVFLVCLRMSTYKESKDNFLTQEGFADMIYNNFLFDIPKILDLCALYKKNPILAKIIENLFNTQKNYIDDFNMCVKDINKGLDTSQKKIQEMFEFESIYDFKEQKNAFKKENNTKKLIKNNFNEALEIIYYLIDFFNSLNSLLVLQPRFAEFLFDNKFERKIAELMENTIFNLEDVLKKVINDEDDTISEIAHYGLAKIRKLKYELGKTFNKILLACSITPIIDNLDTLKHHQNQQIQYYVDNLVRICCELFEEKRFLCFFEEKFKLAEQIELIFEVSEQKMDKSQYDYILSNIKSIILTFSRKSSVRARFEKKSKFLTQNVQEPNKPNTSASFATTSKGSDDVSVDSMVQSVLDLLPDADPNLVKKCLKYYNNNTEQVINAFLENNLPEFPSETLVSGTDSKLSAYMNDYYDTDDFDDVSKAISEIGNRKNIYDGDDFDVFKKDKVDLEKVYLGKKSKADAFDMDDKSELDRDFYKSYDDRIREKEEQDMMNGYEDEYDDTYDEKTNANDNHETDMIIKPLNQKLAVKKRDLFEADSDEEGEDDEEETDDQGQEANQEQSKNNQFSTNKYPNQRGYNSGPQNRNQEQSKNQFGRDRNQGNNQRNFNQSNQNKAYGQRNNDQQPRTSQPTRPQQNQPTRPQQSQPRINDDYQPKQHRSNQTDNKGQSSINQDNRHPNNNQNRSDRQSANQDQRPQQNQQSRPMRLDEPREQRPQPQRNQQNRRQQNNNNNDEFEDDNFKGNATGGPAKTEEEIKRERRWKNENKSKTVHHNRKDLSSKKMGFL